MVGATDWLRVAAQRATRTVPIVTLFNEDPVSTGLIASLARPGGNLTGVSNQPGRELYDKRLQLLRELAPGARRVALLGTRVALDYYSKGADPSVAPPVLVPVERAEQLEAAFAVMARERADALIVSHGPVLYNNHQRLAAFAAERRLPSMFPWRAAVAAGGLICYGPDPHGHFRQLAAYADRILKGAKAADLPVEQPVKFDLVINGKTATALGLVIPPTLLAFADEVIE
jgi:putative ABC transport system substrate-binding protein